MEAATVRTSAAGQAPAKAVAADSGAAVGTRTRSGVVGVGPDGRPREYAFVATPSPAPGEHGVHLMTWGQVASTPLLLDPEALGIGARAAATCRCRTARS